MIVPMKKIAVLTQVRDANQAVESLCDLGVVHIKNIQLPDSQAVKTLLGDIALIDEAVNILSQDKLIKAAGEYKQQEAGDWKFISRHIVDLANRIRQLEEYSWQIKSQIEQWQRWGDFDPESIRELSKKGIFIRLYQIPLKELNTISSQAIVKNIFVNLGMAHCVVISRSNIELAFKEMPLPKLSLSKMRTRLFEDARMIGIIKDDILKHIGVVDSLRKKKDELSKELEFDQALAGMGKEGPIAYLSGFIPVDAVNLFKECARKQQWGFAITDPSAEDNVPTLLRNPRWITFISPVMNFLGILPGYKEIDVSPLFLIFFGTFFGILIGDAGYGLVYFALTFLLQRKYGGNKKAKPVFSLFYILSCCAIIWGILTATFFGQAWLSGIGVSALIPALNDRNVMQTVCFFIGALHLSIAHAWRGVLKFPSIAFLADLGWIMVLWIAYFLAGALILGRPFPDFGLGVGITGIVLVLLFSEPRKNVFQSLGASFNSVTFGLGFMSAFTDVVSYVRLFAVGLAGVAIADTTNFMASGFGSGPAAIIAGVLIVVCGHALNIILGPIAILVHGVRLNVLEFGLNHTGLTWSGVAYKPLTKDKT